MRERLPARRSARTTSIDWRGGAVAVTVGFADDGRVLELFARAGRPDSDLDSAVDDAAVLVSRGLQHGDTLDAMGRGVGRLPDGSPSSIIGAMIDAAIKMETP